MTARHHRALRLELSARRLPRPFVWLAVFAAAVAFVQPLTPARAETAQPEDITTASGLTLKIVRAPGIPLISVRFAISGGSTLDRQGREGTTSLMTTLLTEGAGQLNAEAFARATADQGVRIAFTTTRDHIQGSFDALTARLDASAELLRLTLLEPRFDADAVARAKRQRIADLEIGASDGRRLALERWYAEAFGGHAYGQPVDGTLSSAEAIEREDILTRHRSFTRHALKIVIVGDITPEAATAFVERVFGEMTASPNSTSIGAARVSTAGPPVHVAKEMPVATAAFGLELADRSPASIAAVRVLNQIIGSGDFDSTLMEEIRVKRGLAYAVSTSVVLDDAAALLLGGMATKPENMTTALATLRKVLETLAADGIDSQRFDAAKSYLLGTQPLDLDGNARRATSLLRAWREGRLTTVDSHVGDIEKVTIADVQRAAETFLAWDRLRIVSIGASP